MCHTRWLEMRAIQKIVSMPVNVQAILGHATWTQRCCYGRMQWYWHLASCCLSRCRIQCRDYTELPGRQRLFCQPVSTSRRRLGPLPWRQWPEWQVSARVGKPAIVMIDESSAALLSRTACLWAKTSSGDITGGTASGDSTSVAGLRVRRLVSVLVVDTACDPPYRRL